MDVEHYFNVKVTQEMGKRYFNARQHTALYLARDGRCALCNVELTSGWHADHVTPWVRDGITDIVNGQALCPTCNLKKGAKIIEVEKKKPLRKWQQEALERYDQHQGKAFLVEATMGAGKSRFIAEVVQREHAQKKADAFVIVVPQAALRNQMADDFHDETNIQLNPNWNGRSPLIEGKYKGAVVTYAWVSSYANASLLKMKMGEHPTFVVLDEVHHAREESSWGNAAHEAFDNASRLVLTTGTPFRSDGRPIPWVTYDKEGKAIPDYAYTYGQAISEEEDVVRYLNFLHQDGTMEWLNEDGRQKATFADKVNKRGESERLRTAILQDGDLAGTLLASGIKDLNELRENDPDAAMLVITMDQNHAKDIANRIRKEHGITSPIAISEDSDAADVIKQFKGSQSPCIVSVRMISEGVNIPRIRVIVYLTNVVAELSFKQIMGRAMRVELDHNDHNAWIHLPDDERLRKLARGMQEESDSALREKITKKPSERDGDQPSIFYIPDSATPGAIQATVNGVPISANEFAYATSLKKSNHKAAKGIAPALMALSLKLANIAIPDQRQSNGQEETQQKIQSEEKPYYQRIENAKRLNNKLTGSLVARLCRTKNVKYSTSEYQEMYKKVNVRLNAAAKIGYSGVPNCNDLDKLELRYNLQARWIKDNIEPEEPYSD